MAASNLDARKQAVMEEVKEMGRREGRGKTARLALAEYVTARAREGLIDNNDAEAIWTTMMQGSAEVQTDVGGLDAKDTKQRASDIKHFITLGSQKSFDGVEVLENARNRMKNLRSSGQATGRIWELILAFARAQNKSADRPLEDHEIDRIMEDKSKAERELADVLWGARNTLIKANEGHDHEKIYEAAENIEKVVEELGGTRKQKKAAAAKAAKEKEAAKEAKKVERQGAKKKGGKGTKASTPPTTTH